MYKIFIKLRKREKIRNRERFYNPIIQSYLWKTHGENKKPNKTKKHQNDATCEKNSW